MSRITARVWRFIAFDVYNKRTAQDRRPNFGIGNLLRRIPSPINPVIRRHTGPWYLELIAALCLEALQPTRKSPSQNYPSENLERARASSSNPLKLARQSSIDVGSGHLSEASTRATLTQTNCLVHNTDEIAYLLRLPRQGETTKSKG